MQLRSPGAATPIASRPPVSLTSLVGREREILDLSALVRAQRLVTLTGVGGSGKTRLAAELALRIDWQQADSVAWVELAPCTVAESVTQATASALSLRVTQPCELVDAIVDALHDHELLLVLDDCEHLIAASAELARALLVRCPKLRILATSREPLGIAGEHVWPVPPIAPDEAIQLFVERAAAANPSMQIDREIARDICTRLDGIPLAIELAAARVRVLTPEQIAARLEDRFAILTSGSRTTIPRHRTLRAAIDWSFALLTVEEQTLLARLSIFAGSFSLEAAELICEADLDLLTGLVDKSLVVTTSRRATIRYHLLETIRQYAREHLETSGDADALRRRHALAYSKLVHEAAVDPMGAVLAHLDRLDADRDNVLAALAWSLEHAPDELALPLGAAFRWYWYYRILWNEGLRWLKRVLERTSPSLSHERAAVLAGAGTLASYLGDFETARRWLEEAVSMDRTLGNERELALATSALAHLLGDLNELDEAWSLATESIALARKAGTPYDIAYCLTNALAFVAQRRGDLVEADRALEEAEAIWSPMQHPLGVPLVVNARALVALRRGDHASASTFARRALESTRTSRERWFTARSLRILAITSSDLTRAAKLSGAAEAMLRGIGARMLPHDRDAHAELMNKLHASLPLDGLQAALAEGNAMCFDEACELALDDTPLLEPSNETLHVSDLGALQITLGGKPLASEGRASNRARELLVFLLAHPPGPTKDEAGVAFWPDASAEQVKNSFHVTLHRLRKLLGGSETVITDSARYVVAIPHVAQSQQFESAINVAMRSNDIDALERALALYQGDFLQGEDAGEWCLPIRARLRQLHIRGLFALAQAHESKGRFVDAAETYTRVLARDPFHEAAARQLMICRAKLGARSESLLVYRELEQRLRDDLQATPEPETRTLYQRLKNGAA